MKWLRGLFQSAPRTPPDHTPFLQRLESLGFFTHSSPDNTQSIRAEILRLGWPGVFAHEGRFFHADAEELAEGGILGFLEAVSPFLVAEGVAVPDIQDDLGEDHYKLRWAGREYVVYDASELAREEEEPGRLWAIATVRTFALVNDLLGSTRSHERLYAVNGGNDLFGLFLAPVQLAEIVAYAGNDARGAPYEVQDAPPWYGARE